MKEFFSAIGNYLLNKAFGRKFLAFVIGTIALFTGHLTEETWLWIFMTYVGAEGAIDVVGRFKGQTANSNNSNGIEPTK